MPNEQENDRPQPKTKQTPSVLDDRISFAVSNKGGISIYGLRRFPFTFYKSELETILGLGDELKEYMASEEIVPLLASDKPDGRGLDKTESYTVNVADVALVAAEAERLTAEGKVQDAIRYATIANVAKLNKNKVSPEDMLTIMTLKAKK